jgi:hypothetical protein
MSINKIAEQVYPIDKDPIEEAKNRLLREGFIKGVKMERERELEQRRDW